MEIKYNPKRDEIALGYIPDWSEEYWAAIFNFEKMTIQQLRELVELDQIDLKVKRRAAPTIKEFMIFMEKYPNTTAHGFVISPRRIDAGIAIRGLEYIGEYTKEQLKDFVNLCKKDRKLIVEDNKLYCWFY